MIYMIDLAMKGLKGQTLQLSPIFASKPRNPPIGWGYNKVLHSGRLLYNPHILDLAKKFPKVQTLQHSPIFASKARNLPLGWGHSKVIHSGRLLRPNTLA